VDRFFTSEHLFSWKLFGPTEATITVIVIHAITVYTSPVIWQYVIDFGVIPGIQINHIFYLVYWFYIIYESVSSIRTVLWVQQKQKITVFYDEVVNAHIFDVLWGFVWAIQSLVWCFTGTIYEHHPRIFLFSVVLIHSILLVSIVDL
jgi:hypothetical protein